MSECVHDWVETQSRPSNWRCSKCDEWQPGSRFTQGRPTAAEKDVTTDLIVGQAREILGLESRLATLEAERDGFAALVTDVLEFREAFDSGRGRANWERRARRALATTQEETTDDHG